MTGFDTIKFEKKNGIAYVTLNRPQLLNAYNTRMRDELYQALDAIKDDNEVQVAIFKGEGDRAFCAGADLSEFLTAPSPVAARKARFERDVWGLFLSVPQPLIAAIHGFCLGSGIEIALCCDLRVATEDARFGLPEVGLGIIPAAGGTQTLPRTVGRGWALEMLLSGNLVNAAEAYRMALVNRVVPRGEHVSAAEALALKIMEHAPRAVRAAKQAINRGLDMTLEQGLEMERDLALPLMVSEDTREGLRAFKEGRKPKFAGR
ncbi:MAG: enoyl-CoA hydratase/isomerase family protein [Chloroflexi bacterium]|nr:enoyl-CoA hydratase/isomerase family protein [Chloroflexota bacterium]